jgi:3-hydroxyisobutyrate dehydrogenase-like beta-hydroxyacid dehydrogenase
MQLQLLYNKSISTLIGVLDGGARRFCGAGLRSCCGGLMTLRLALIGFGEVGTIFATDFLATGAAEVKTYDILFDDRERRAATLAKARAVGAAAAVDARSACAGADIVISAVTASAAEEVAVAAGQYLAPRQIFFDVNSAAPATKQRSARALERSGAHYVEGAVMAPVSPQRLKVPILAGGAAAVATAEKLNALGMAIRPVATEIGRASATKLCRSIMIKGIEALILDCARASRLHGVEAEVFASLAATFPGHDWLELADHMAERVHQHGIRRAAEMREAADMLADLGLDPKLCRAVAEAQERGAGAQERGDASIERDATAQKSAA